MTATTETTQFAKAICLDHDQRENIQDLLDLGWRIYAVRISRCIDAEGFWDKIHHHLGHTDQAAVIPAWVQQ